VDSIWKLGAWRGSLTAHVDRRLAVAMAGSLIMLVGYVLPMFPSRILAAQTTFSDGTMRDLTFPTLIAGQHLLQEAPVPDAHVQAISIKVGPSGPSWGSGWAWMLEVMANPTARREHVSYLMTLGLPIVTAGLLIGLAAWQQRRAAVPRRPIPLAVNAALLSVIALPLSWLHQVDFSLALFSLAPGALAPGPGFWVALGGAVGALGGVWRMRHETHRKVFSWWHLVLAVAVGIWLLARARPYPYLEIWRFISDGIVVTLRIVLISFAFTLVVSLLGGLGRISRSPIIYGVSSLYVEIIRGIPLLVQLLFIWYALPQVFDSVGELLVAISPALSGPGEWLIALRLDPFTAAVIGFTICYGAYGTEIFRAGISAIHHGQIEAARSLGMTYVQAMRYIILPQAVRVILPPVGNEFVALLKDSSLVSVLAVSDLTRRGREYMARTFLSFDTWILVALCYLVLTLFSSRVVEFIESKSRFER